MIVMERPGKALDDVATVGGFRRALAEQFRDASLDSPDLDARLIVGHALGLDHAALAAAPGRALTAAERERVMAFAARRLVREPVARIVGHKGFWDLDLAVTPAVLVPRPETETVVEAALALIDADDARRRALRIADLGTGSGAILLALLRELPNAHGIGTDRDRAAIAVAHANAARAGLTERAAFACCDFGAALAGGLDIVVSNPPYITSSDIAALEPEVRDHDPRLALDGGADGLSCYRAIAADAPRLLAPGGFLVVELGAGQEAPVAALLEVAGLTLSGPARRDLAGHPRALAASLTHEYEASPTGKKSLGIWPRTD